MIIKHQVFQDPSPIGGVFDKFLIQNIKIVEVNMTMDLSRLKMHLYKINTNEEIDAFTDKYISLDSSLLPIELQSAQQHQHCQVCKKKKKVVSRFHYPLPLMPTTKNS